jgi:hypothetical protein
MWIVRVPVFYIWTIEDAGVYVGKYKNIHRPRREYRRNVERLLSGEPYRKNKPDKFRRIHHALANAVREGKRLTLTILENPLPENLNARERELILKIGNLNA